jgi:hypothetical protein
MKPDCILLGDLHGLQMFEPGAFGHPVFSVVEQVPNIRDVADIPDGIIQVEQVPVNDVKAHKRATVAEVDVVVNRGAANIHAHPTRNDGGKYFFLA